MSVTVETARTVFFAVAGGMWLVWLAGTWFAFSRLNPKRGGASDRPEDAGAADALTGEALIEGDPEVISKKLAEQLVTLRPGAGVSLVNITERTAERVAFEKAAGAGQPPVFDDGLVTLRPEGSRVRVRYAVSTKRFTRVMRIVTGLVCFVYGGLFVLVAPALIWLLIVNNENEVVRKQVFQTFQMVHGVWPPFLVGFLSGRLRKMTARFFDSLVANLEHIV